MPNKNNIVELKDLRGKTKDEILKIFDHKEADYDSNEWLISLGMSWFGIQDRKLYIYFDHERKVEFVLRP